jgi:hypothetical protein
MPNTFVNALKTASKRFVDLLRKLFTWNDHTWKRGVTFVVALALLGLGLTIWGVEGRLQEPARNPFFALFGGLLVVVVLLRAVYALFGKAPALSTPASGAPDPNSADGKKRAAQAEKLNYRWRIGWAVGALMVATIAVTAVTFAVTDRIRTGTTFCDTAKSAEPSASTPVAPTTTESTTDTTVPTTDTTVPGSSVPEDQGAQKEEFGVERGIRSHTLAVKAATAEEADAIKKEDFSVYADDGYSETDFARIESVRPLTNGDAQIRMQIDMSCHSALEGGTQSIIAVYHGKIQLDQSRWDMEVSLQSRLVFFALALVPIIVVLAMWQTFAVWPTSLKRWFTSVVAVGIPVLSAFTAAGLRNSTWSPDLLTIGTLIGTAYAAGITAANLVKNGGHDLDKPKPDAD